MRYHKSVAARTPKKPFKSGLARPSPLAYLWPFVVRTMKTKDKLVTAASDSEVIYFFRSSTMILSDNFPRIIGQFVPLTSSSLSDFLRATCDSACPLHSWESNDICADIDEATAVASLLERIMNCLFYVICFTMNTYAIVNVTIVPGCLFVSFDTFVSSICCINWEPRSIFCPTNL